VGVNNERATKISANPTHNTPLHVGKSGFIIDCNAEYIRDTSDNGVLTTSRNLYNKICTFIPHNTNPVLTSEMSGSRVVATFNVRLPTNPFLSTVRVLDPDIGHNGSINANLNVTAQNGAHANLSITPNATSMKVVFVKRITGVNNQLHAAILTFYPNS
ncbi:MAG: hypothetical protein LBP31_01385, partial [Holosporales bacterium]|nr:hypothetical protein [Holosporales bacterium]